MRKIAIVGGKLQGMEVCYLGKKAGIHVTLIDKDKDAPGRNMCDRFILGDILGGDPEILEVLRGVDMVLPTLENDDVLFRLEELSRKLGFVYAFHGDTYKVSSSKILSDNFFHLHEIPSPRYFPQGEAPYIAKPDNESGSHGVQYLDSREEAEGYCKVHRDDRIIQEYLEGPSYSIEIIGFPGNYRTYEITRIHMADDYDCRMVTAPCDALTPAAAEEFSKMAVKVASLLNLKGIMDLEVIHHQGELKLLEIDARFPSQTPSVVYHTSGMNLLEELYDLYMEEGFKKPYPKDRYYSSFEHHLWNGGKWEAAGEHIMVEGHPLELVSGLWGADHVITDYGQDPNTFRVTLINQAEGEEGLMEKKAEVWKCLKNIR